MRYETIMNSKIVILGTGFASISCVNELKKHISKKKLDITLIGEENYFVFQPMLPEVASGNIEASHIISSVRSISSKINFFRANVKNINLKSKEVTIVGNDIKKEKIIEFDHLIIGLGLSNDFTRIQGMSEHSYPLKNLGDAFFLRNEVINKLEEAAIEPNKKLQKAMLTFVVIGGGFSGVETAGQLNDYLKKAIKQYPSLNKNDLSVYLIHSRERILKELSSSLGTYAQEKCRERGIKILLNTRVSQIFENKVLLSNSDEIFTKTIINTTGNAPNSVLTKLNCINEKGRLDTNEYFQVLNKKRPLDAQLKELSNIWAIGDCAFIPDITSKKPKLCPPTAQYATRQGKICAQNIVRKNQNQPLKKFKFKLIGQLATIGHLVGVAEIFNFRFSGFLAFFIWRTIYWLKLPGLGNKYRVALDWAASIFFPPDTSQINVFRTASVSRSHYPKDTFICKQGDIPDYFYIIEKGKVAVLRKHKNKPTIKIATLSAGDSFGEMGLIEQIPRQASIKCLTSVEVLKVMPEDFHSIIGTHSTFRKQIEAKIEGIKQQNT